MSVPILTIVRVPALAAWDGLHAFTLLALMVLLVLVFRGTIRLGVSTLAAPRLWALISVVSLLLVAIQVNSPTSVLSPGLDALRYAALVTTFCPLMAVLGAKRPQDRGWQWVVGTLWLVLVWPAGQTVALMRGEIELFVAWKLFLFGLIALGPLNYLPTRHWLASLLTAGGQTVLLSNYLWEVSDEAVRWLLPIGSACFLLAATIVTWQARLSATSEQPAHTLDAYTRQWLRFRDAYGAFWALRIQGRVNQTAELRQWPMRLAWHGFDHPEDETPNPEQLSELQQALESLLRRFL